MSVVTVIKEVKKIHKEDVVLIKIGNFYHCYGKDAYIISFLFNYKLRKTRDNYYTCGFPEKSIGKVENVLVNKKINYIILDSRDNYNIDVYENYKNLNNYTSVLEKAKKNIKIKEEISLIYNKLKKKINDVDIYDKIRSINKIIEDKDEGRKV